MALAVTSLVGAIGRSQKNVAFTAYNSPSVGGIGPDILAMIDQERCLITSSLYSPTVELVRGYDGTYATAHNALAPVVYGLSSDFTDLASQGAATIAIAPAATYSVNGAITVPIVNQTIYITKSGVCALTLGAPASDQVNRVEFISLTANAHTVTYTPGFYGNTTSSDVATFPATVGGSFIIEAKNGLWVPIATSASGVTFG